MSPLAAGARMRTESENRARTVIYDPVMQNLRATRYGLYEAGFRDIEGFSELSGLRNRLNDGPMDLLVAEADDGGAVFDLVRALRRGEVAENPFAVVFLTSWHSGPDTVKTALRSGADDIIARPFSTCFIETRVRAAVENRKQFVVTSDYLGPDRRQDEARESGMRMRMFTPPNTLKSAMRGDHAAMEARSTEIEMHKDLVRRERAVRLAVRIGVEAELAAEGRRPSSMVYGLARELYVAVDQVDPEAAKLAAAMVRGLSSGEDVQKSFKLARELALAICVLCGGGDEAEGEGGEEQYVSEIERLLGALRSKPGKAA